MLRGYIFGFGFVLKPNFWNFKTVNSRTGNCRYIDYKNPLSGIIVEKSSICNRLQY